MLIKSLKFAMVFAVVLTFLGGTAMADNRGHQGHPGRQAYKWEQHYAKHNNGNPYHYRHARRFSPPREPHRQSAHRISKPNPLAPRIVFLGPIPVPVPPSPHEVLGFIAGHR